MKQSVRTVKLNLTKFIDFLDKHKYIIASIYCEKNRIRFIECRTPKYQKTFIVYLPEKYEMISTDKSSLERLSITSTDSPPSIRQSKYMTDIKGPLLECDILSISSDMLCAFHNVGKAECFYIEEEAPDEKTEENSEDGEIENESDDEVKMLESETTTLLQKVKPGATLPEAKVRKRNSKTPEEPKIEENDDEEEYVVEDEEDEYVGEEEEELSETQEQGPVDLVFEDENGEPYDEVKSILDNSSNAEKSLDTLQEKIAKRDAETFGDNEDELGEDDENEENTSGDNSLPPQIEEAELTLGMIYIMIDISIFFKRVSSGVCEEEIIKCYDQIEDNEVDMRKERLTKIKKLCENFTNHAEDRMKFLSTEENNLKTQLIRLTVVLAQAEQLTNRVESQPEKYGNETIKEAQGVYKRTRDTIHNLNTEILKLRDTADEILSNYSSTIKELMAM